MTCSWSANLKSSPASCRRITVIVTGKSWPLIASRSAENREHRNATHCRPVATKHGLAHACRVLWNTNEFVFVD